MPVCKHGTRTPSGRCRMCKLEKDWEHHDFFRDLEESEEKREHYEEEE